MKLWNKIKNWFYRVILGRIYFMGIDYSTSKDLTCKIEGYRSNKGIYKIKSIEFIKYYR